MNVVGSIKQLPCDAFAGLVNKPLQGMFTVPGPPGLGNEYVPPYDPLHPESETSEHVLWASVHAMYVANTQSVSKPRHLLLISIVKTIEFKQARSFL